LEAVNACQSGVLTTLKTLQEDPAVSAPPQWFGSYRKQIQRAYSSIG
jgi:hypothetical protein